MMSRSASTAAAPHCVCLTHPGWKSKTSENKTNENRVEKSQKRIQSQGKKKADPNFSCIAFRTPLRMINLSESGSLEKG